MCALNLRIKYQIEVHDKNGKRLVKRTGTCKSLLRNFMLWLHAWFQVAQGTSTGGFTAPDTSNTSRSFFRGDMLNQPRFGAFNAPSGTSAYGLRIGSSAIPVAPTDFELRALIPHGSGAGQMMYGAQAFEPVTTSGNETFFRITRTFTNNSGASITVREIGGAFSAIDGANIERFICYLRDVLPSAVTVPDGSTFTLRYIFSITT